MHALTRTHMYTHTVICWLLAFQTAKVGLSAYVDLPVSPLCHCVHYIVVDDG